MIQLLMAISISQMRIQECIADIAPQYDIECELVEAIVETESSFNPDAESKCGAQGLMQIMPKWHQKRMQELEVDDLFDEYSNILVGCDYLAELIELYDGNETKALMVYHMGWRGARLYDEGTISNYAKNIIKRAWQIKEERDDIVRNNLGIDEAD